MYISYTQSVASRNGESTETTLMPVRLASALAKELKKFAPNDYNAATENPLERNNQTP